LSLEVEGYFLARAQDIKLALLWFAVFAMLARGKDFWLEAAFGPVHFALSVTQSD
jgi:hypothetical protein